MLHAVQPIGKRMLQGTTLKNRYAIGKQIGEGGMATVYRAFDMHCESQVAIKHFIKAKDTDSIEFASFQKEVASLRQLKDEHIVSLLDDGLDDDHNPYLVLELMDCDLKAFRRDGNVFESWEDYMQTVGFPVLEALALAHSRGITHRDVAPKNVLIRGTGNVKLADFGIAKLKGLLDAGKTIQGFGTKPFAAPEPDDGFLPADARDVFSYAALFIWSMSNDAVTEYDTLRSAAETVLTGIPGEFSSVFQQCLASNPDERIRNAVILKTTLETLWRTEVRQKKRIQKARIRVVTDSAKGFLANDVASDGVDQAVFIEADINDSPTVSWYRSEKEPNTPQFTVLGGQCSYHIKYSEDDNELVVLNIRKPDFGTHQYRKDGEAALPIHFTLKTLVPGLLKPRDVLTVIDDEIAAHEQGDTAEQIDDPFEKKLRSVLSAKFDIERSRIPPVRYEDLNIDGRLVAMVVADREPFEIDQTWAIGESNKRVRLRVDAVSGNQVTFEQKRKRPKSHLPAQGYIQFENSGSLQNLERQETALDSLLNGTSVRSDLKSLLSEPEMIRPPRPGSVSLDWKGVDLDEPKQKAIESALSTDDFLVVHGPPGTGKTRFISHLIQRIKQVDSDSRVVLASQTNVAVDNAIERVAMLLPECKIVRIAPDLEKVADGTKRFHADKQFERWKAETEKASDGWVRQWATKQGVDPDNVILGCRLRELATLKEKRESLTSRVADAVDAYEELSERDEQGLSGAELEDLALARRDVEDLKKKRNRLNADIETVVTQVSRLPYGHAECGEWSIAEISEMADAMIGDTGESLKIRDVVKLRGEWLGVFASGDSFNAALCERADVVAGTCIGLAGMKGASDVEYDWCIIDEASKATALEAFVPMVQAKKWLLVGDSKQLPPHKEFDNLFEDILKEHDITNDELSESLFPQHDIANFSLLNFLPNACQCELSKQYRMCEPIGSLISKCFYDGRLDAGTRPPKEFIVGEFGTPVVWISSSDFHDKQEVRSKTSKSRLNPRETNLILEHLKRLNSIVDPGYSVLVLSSYVLQVEAMRKAVQVESRALDNLNIECCTSEAVQGREAEAVYYSLTRTVPSDWVDDQQRLNVTLSRARELLVVVGDDSVVRNNASRSPHLSSVVSYMDNHPDSCSFVQKLFGQEI